MGQAFQNACPIPLMRRVFIPTLASFSLFFLVISAVGQTVGQPAVADSSSAAKNGLHLAEAGHCAEALPVLKKSAPRLTDRDLKRRAGFAGVRCGLALNQPGAVADFLNLLNREFPLDPEVLYVSVHAYSDLSERASLELARTAPSSLQARELNAESLEVQGRWGEAAKEYQQILEQDPSSPGIHFRLGRALLSQSTTDPAAAEQAKKEFQQELAIDPKNAGAEYVLGGLARRDAQWEEAVEHYTRATKLDPGFADAFLGLGSSLNDSRKFSDAIAPLEKAVKLEPGNPTARYNLGIAYSRSGRKEDAEREFAIHQQLTQKQGAAGGDAPPSAPPESPR